MSALLTNVQLAALRAWVAANDMPDTCTIQRKTGDVNTKGIPTPTYDAGTPTACRYIRGKGTETTADGKVVATNLATFVFPVSTTITPVDRILYGGATFNILDVPSAAALDVSLVVTAQKRT
jgi:hypothetical protein